MMKKGIVSLFLILINSTITYSNNTDLTQKLQISTEQINEIHKGLEGLEDLMKREWSPYYYVMPLLIERYNLEVGCEVGVSAGFHSCHMLRNTNLKKLYSVDPYIVYGDPTNADILDANTMEIFYTRVANRLGAFAERSELIRDFSDNAAARFEDNQLDFVFIDANHTYEFVKKDIEVWYAKVRSGGLICGDDYATAHPGVKQAVDEYFGMRGLTVLFECNNRIWYVQKP